MRVDGHDDVERLRTELLGTKKGGVGWVRKQSYWHKNIFLSAVAAGRCEQAGTDDEEEQAGVLTVEYSAVRVVESVPFCWVYGVVHGGRCCESRKHE